MVAGALPLRGSAAGDRQQLLGEGVDLAGGLGDRDEFVRRHEAAHGVLPARQRLGADDMPGAEIDDGLEMRRHGATDERAAQIVGELETAAGLAGVIATRVLDVVAAEALGLVQGGVGRARERLGAGAILGEQRDAEAQAERQLAAGDREIWGYPMKFGSASLAVTVRKLSCPSTIVSEIAKRSPP